MPDPCSWLQIEQGWNVVTSDGAIVGTVAQVEGDKESDIFDGLAVGSTEPNRLLYVPGEQVGPIYHGEVTLKLASTETGTLERFEPAPPETIIRPGQPPLGARLSNWLRGRRR
jgi:sporulation protein YlmC with PRC-barrel domain